MDEGIEDDPFRVVMFSDIKPFLVLPPVAPGPAFRFNVIDAFLLFCQRPPVFGKGHLVKAAMNDPFLSRGSQALEKHFLERRGDAVDRLEDLSKMPPISMQHAFNIAISPDVLFAGPGWFNYLYQARDEAVDPAWVVNIIRRLVTQNEVGDLAEYLMAIEWLNAPSSVKKVAKGLLRKHPSNARLYNAYALAEWRNGNVDVARTVLSSATTQNLVSLHCFPRAPAKAALIVASVCKVAGPFREAAAVEYLDLG
jgi:hypothetical protein